MKIESNPNSAESWDELWRTEGLKSWRGSAMEAVYERLLQLVPKQAKVLDVGGGVGLLALKLSTTGRDVEVWDISPHAISMVKRQGMEGRIVDLETSIPDIEPGTVVIATEVLEHLTEPARARFIAHVVKAGGVGFFSVPNDRLPPEEEPQHTRTFTAMELKRYLGTTLEHVRVEVLGPPAMPHGDPSFLLAVCGVAKQSSLSVTLPVRDEGADLGRVLASFRGVADEIIIGIDPRTKDNTFEVASRYADEVFYLVDPEGPVPGSKYEGSRCSQMARSGEKRMPEGGVHFSWVRNQCLDQCTSEWIFMTEGHESLIEGLDVLLNLHQLADPIKIALVWRSDLHGQRWGFPWLHRNNDRILYERGTHNSLQFPDEFMVVKLPQVRTLHERDHSRTVERAKQRKTQNRVSLMDDWMRRGSEFSKYYLASEMRELSLDRSERHFQELLALPKRNGPMRYQARLILAKLLALKGDSEGARQTLLGCSEEDWSRTEHWIWLGDLAAERDQWEEAIQFYLYGASRVGNPPFTTWWIDMSFYSFLPAQRLAAAYGEQGDAERSLHWAKIALEQLPKEAPEELFKEAHTNISMLEGALHAA